MVLNWAFGDVYGPIEAHMWPCEEREAMKRKCLGSL